MNAYNIENSLRLTVGTEEENNKFLDILENNF
jgi:histidinol-phosphate/aromatic aminotransferase/cobyric acid decarboxylase-like protein